MAYIYDIADTWAVSGTTYTGIKLNVTDSGPSAAASLLMDLQVGGVSRFSVSKNGLANVPNTGTNGTTGYAIANVNVLTQLAGNTAILDMANGVIFAPTGTTSSNSANYRFGTSANGGATLAATLPFGWSAGLGMDTKDTIILRDAANTLAQRNGVNAQAFNLYNTYTDASNYERGFMRFVSNVLQIGSDKLGTGTARGLEFHTNGINRMALATSGTLDLPGTAMGGGAQQLTVGRIVYAGEGYRVGNTFQVVWSNGVDYSRGVGVGSSGGLAVTNGTTGGQSLEFREMTAPAAPSANNVVVYAEDDGAGKTRLMARFATGVAQQIAIEP